MHCCTKSRYHKETLVLRNGLQTKSLLERETLRWSFIERANGPLRRSKSQYFLPYSLISYILQAKTGSLTCITYIEQGSPTCIIYIEHRDWIKNQSGNDEKVQISAF
jgi:hypothetical protein